MASSNEMNNSKTSGNKKERPSIKNIQEKKTLIFAFAYFFNNCQYYCLFV
jgi:hypothetical protein